MTTSFYKYSFVILSFLPFVSTHGCLKTCLEWNGEDFVGFFLSCF